MAWRSMRLVVTDPQEGLVAEVDVAPDNPLHTDPDTPHVTGSFIRGPAFPAIQAILDRFLAAFGSGNMRLASEIHEEIDRRGLVATTPTGGQYSVFNVCFQPNGLLFSIARRHGRSRSEGRCS